MSYVLCVVPIRMIRLLAYAALSQRLPCNTLDGSGGRSLPMVKLTAYVS